MNKWIKLVLGLLAGLVFSLVLASVLVLRALKPAPGEWTHTLQLGPWSHEVSVPAALHIASHPFVLRLLEGRTLRTRYGAVRWEAVAAPNTWRAVCAPCTFQRRELGREAIRLSRVEFTVVPDMEMRLQGSFALGEAPQALQGRWSSRIEAQRLVLSFSVADEPVARAFALFARDIPELGQAQIEGRLSAKAQWVLPTNEFALKPSIVGLRVAGLGTQALLNAQPACGEADGFGTWLPRAVIAAEDQRFYEHAGFDMAEIMAAWSGPSAGDMPRGASTLPQQLAKLLYTGDSRSHGRKLRELLYAVELDRVLGKARALNLYLAIVPWGDGQCGAHAAARHYLRKAPDALSPMEAVWLATLLHNPDRELAQLARNGVVNAERVDWVADQLRPVPVRERERLRRAMKRWQPPREALTSAMAVAASQAAAGR
ncbi:biosynthetic peptidoglycan transglycosylase [Sphaerotilaceae bacterium SBD11-9]